MKLFASFFLPLLSLLVVALLPTTKAFATNSCITQHGGQPARRTNDKRLVHQQHQGSLARNAAARAYYMVSPDNNNPNEKMFSSKVYDTIQEGKIAVVPNFLNRQEVSHLRQDAQGLHSEGCFTTDALASYATAGNFDPSKDRAVLKLKSWKNEGLGDWNVRSRFGNRMAALRSDLAYELDRPGLDHGVCTSASAFGNGSTEISYTRFGPGAFLRRHVDEHHEELKGKDGWLQPTRRSISWLIYLNDEDWNPRLHGGQLRCFERKTVVASTSSSSPSTSRIIGAQPNGDLQIGWLRSTILDPVERPVYMDARRQQQHHSNGNCAMYMQNDDGSIQYITKDFDSHPWLYTAVSETMIQKLLINRSDLASRFQLIEKPKSRLDGLMASSGEDEMIADVDPIGGTLVMFDSVSLPHEVRATIDRERWATSGWFHEDQQHPIKI